MASLLVYPDPAPVEITAALVQAGHSVHAVDTTAAELRDRPTSGWACAVLIAGSGVDDVAAFTRTLRTDTPDTPVLLVVPVDAIAELAGHGDCFDDFCVRPLRPAELAVRVSGLLGESDVSGGDTDGVIAYGPLLINPVTYQAVIDGAPLDLTYMEYELLKYFAQRPGRVCTREILLSQVWGYEYYGGARTVDVHVRRLRAKLGEVHAGLIATVRSVGYRFGSAEWG